MLSPNVGGLALELPDCLTNTALPQLSRAAPAQLAPLPLRARDVLPGRRLRPQGSDCTCDRQRIIMAAENRGEIRQELQ